MGTSQLYTAVDQGPGRCHPLVLQYQNQLLAKTNETAQPGFYSSLIRFSKEIYPDANFIVFNYPFYGAEFDVTFKFSL